MRRMQKGSNFQAPLTCVLLTWRWTKLRSKGNARKGALTFQVTWILPVRVWGGRGGYGIFLALQNWKYCAHRPFAWVHVLDVISKAHFQGIFCDYLLLMWTICKKKKKWPGKATQCPQTCLAGCADLMLHNLTRRVVNIGLCSHSAQVCTKIPRWDLEEEKSIFVLSHKPGVQRNILEALSKIWHSCRGAVV